MSHRPAGGLHADDRGAARVARRAPLPAPRTTGRGSALGVPDGAGPHWEPLERIDERVVPTVEVESDVRERAGRAIQDQVAAGGRARKTNPKRKALTSLGETDAAGIADLVLEVHDGRLQPDEVEDVLRRLAGTR